MRVLAVLLAFLAAAPQEPRLRKIVLLAGPLDSHPRDSHEYEKNVILLKHLLETSPGVKGAKVEVHFNGWPADPATLDDADTIFLTSGGCDHRLEDHPLYVGDRLAVLERQMKRGCGLVQFHWSTFNPTAHHDQVTEWVGGYFDYETGPGQNHWYSKIETHDWQTVVATPDHPVSRGVRPFKLKEEFYFNLRFREDDPRLKPILLSREGDVRSNTVGYAVERKDGGRGFGFTGGHFTANWWIPEFRKLVLNAIAWTAHLEVPEGGIDSTLEAPRRALILTGHNHPAHDWRATTAALLFVLEQDPRIKVEVTENPEDLATSRMEGVDLLVLNYCNWDRPGLSEAAKKGLLGYLARGGGLEVVHFANGAFNSTLPAKDSDWEEYRTKIVRRAWMHPESAHDDYGPFRVEMTPARHPITEGLSPFDVTDELYVHQKGPLPIEPLATARSKKTGELEPMAWAYGYEKARVFQTVLGHADVSIRKAGRLLRRGAAWAANLPPLSFDPPPEQTERAVFRAGSPWTPKKSQEAPKPQGPKEEPKKEEKKEESLLPPDPGLDGGKGGHWGMTGEKDWADSRWNQADIGPFITSALKVGEETLLRAISIRVGDGVEGGVVFDPDALSFRAGWTGKWIAFSPARYGLIEKPRIAGDLQWTAPPGAIGQYAGLSLLGNRVRLSYRFGRVFIRETPWLERSGGMTAFSRTFELDSSGSQAIPIALLGGSTGTLETLDGVSLAVLRSADRLVAAGLTGGALDGLALAIGQDGRIELRVKPEVRVLKKLLLFSGAKEELGGFARMVKESPAAAIPKPSSRWPERLTTKGFVSKEKGPYVIDTLTVPYDNPWKALFFISGVDFFSNGDAAISTIHGDVWRVSGIDQGLEKLTWRRFATGLYQALGLRIVKDEVYVLGRDRITRLRDTSGEGEADEYESFSSQLPTSAAGHDFITCLETDKAGNFYFTSWKGLFRVSPDGEKTELVATGFRNPNGLSIGPDGTITVAPQEGEWTPASMICQAKRGGFYGYGGPRVTPERPTGVDPALVYLPRAMDNSTGGQVWVESDRWGPLQGQLLSLSYGRCTMQLVLRDAASEIPQGAVVPLKGTYASGIMRGRFRPADGQLYVVGTKGWVSASVRDGCLQRVRYTGGPIHLPIGLASGHETLTLTFAEPLDRESAESPDSYALDSWNYLYAEKYGSEEYSPSRPGVVGHDPVTPRGVKLSEDGRSVTFDLPGLKPVHQLRIRHSLRDREGASVRGEVVVTLNRVR
jgi:type 1 glutamine amidotransferase